MGINEPVISVENLSKSYILQHKQQERYIALRDVIAEKIKKPFSKNAKKTSRSQLDEFWALKDVSF